MEAAGQGVVYTRTTRGAALREPDARMRRRRIDALFLPYHEALAREVDAMLERWGRCTILDGHSFATLPLPSERDQEPDRPDICIGTDVTHTPPDLASALERAFRAEGFEVRRDSPFAGTFVPLRHYGRELRVRSVMVEIRRGLYCDEATGRALPRFADVRDAIDRALVAGRLLQAD
jgi:N-formylglutamate amidohydrolase